MCELRRTNNPNPIKIKIPACLIHNKVNSPSTDVTQGYDSIQNCLKSNFLFFCLQLLTHHHPSCYPYQFLFIKFLIIKFLLINFLLIMFICFSIGLAEKSKKNSKLVFRPTLYIKDAGFLGNLFCPLKKDPPETLKI